MFVRFREFFKSVHAREVEDAPPPNVKIAIFSSFKEEINVWVAYITRCTV